MNSRITGKAPVSSRNEKMKNEKWSLTARALSPWLQSLTSCLCQLLHRITFSGSSGCPGDSQSTRVTVGLIHTRSRGNILGFMETTVANTSLRTSLCEEGGGQDNIMNLDKYDRNMEENVGRGEEKRGEEEGKGEREKERWKNTKRQKRREAHTPVHVLDSLFIQYSRNARSNGCSQWLVIKTVLAFPIPRGEKPGKLSTLPISRSIIKRKVCWQAWNERMNRGTVAQWEDLDDSGQIIPILDDRCHGPTFPSNLHQYDLPFITQLPIYESGRWRATFLQEGYWPQLVSVATNGRASFTWRVTLRSVSPWKPGIFLKQCLSATPNPLSSLLLAGKGVALVLAGGIGHKLEFR